MHPSIRTAPHMIVILRHHPIALLAQLFTCFFLGMILSAIGVLGHVESLIIAGILLALLLAAYAWQAWRIFTVHVRYDRIIIRHLRLGSIQEDIYPVPGRNGMTRRQSPLDRPIDTGAITLYLPDHTVRLSMLTPFSAATRVLGLDS